MNSPIIQYDFTKMTVLHLRLVMGYPKMHTDLGAVLSVMELLGSEKVNDTPISDLPVLLSDFYDQFLVYFQRQMALQHTVNAFMESLYGTETSPDGGTDLRTPPGDTAGAG